MDYFLRNISLVNFLKDNTILALRITCNLENDKKKSSNVEEYIELPNTLENKSDVQSITDIVLSNKSNIHFNHKLNIIRFPLCFINHKIDFSIDNSQNRDYKNELIFTKMQEIFNENNISYRNLNTLLKENANDKIRDYTIEGEICPGLYNINITMYPTMSISSIILVADIFGFFQLFEEKFTNKLQHHFIQSYIFHYWINRDDCKREWYKDGFIIHKMENCIDDIVQNSDYYFPNGNKKFIELCKQHNIDNITIFALIISAVKYYGFQIIDRNPKAAQYLLTFISMFVSLDETMKDVLQQRNISLMPHLLFEAYNFKDARYDISVIRKYNSKQWFKAKFEEIKDTSVKGYNFITTLLSPEEKEGIFNSPRFGKETRRYEDEHKNTYYIIESQNKSYENYKLFLFHEFDEGEKIVYKDCITKFNCKGDWELIDEDNDDNKNEIQIEHINCILNLLHHPGCRIRGRTLYYTPINIYFQNIQFHYQITHWNEGERDSVNCFTFKIIDNATDKSKENKLYYIVRFTANLTKLNIIWQYRRNGVFYNYPLEHWGELECAFLANLEKNFYNNNNDSNDIFRYVYFKSLSQKSGSSYCIFFDNSGIGEEITPGDPLHSRYIRRKQLNINVSDNNNSNDVQSLLKGKMRCYIMDSTKTSMCWKFENTNQHFTAQLSQNNDEILLKLQEYWLKGILFRLVITKNFTYEAHVNREKIDQEELFQDKVHIIEIANQNQQLCYVCANSQEEHINKKKNEK